MRFFFPVGYFFSLLKFISWKQTRIYTQYIIQKFVMIGGIICSLLHHRKEMVLSRAMPICPSKTKSTRKKRGKSPMTSKMTVKKREKPLELIALQITRAKRSIQSKKMSMKNTLDQKVLKVVQAIPVGVNMIAKLWRTTRKMTKRVLKK